MKKPIAVDEGDQIGPGKRLVVVKPTAGGLRRRPGGPAVGLVDDKAIWLAHQLHCLGALVLQVVQILEK